MCFAQGWAQTQGQQLQQLVEARRETAAVRPAPPPLPTPNRRLAAAQHDICKAQQQALAARQQGKSKRDAARGQNRRDLSATSASKPTRSSASQQHPPAALPFPAFNQAFAGGIFTPSTMFLGLENPVVAGNSTALQLTAAAHAAAAAGTSAAVGAQIFTGFTPLVGFMSPPGCELVNYAFATGADPQLAEFVGQELSRQKLVSPSCNRLRLSWACTRPATHLLSVLDCIAPWVQ